MELAAAPDCLGVDVGGVIVEPAGVRFYTTQLGDDPFAALPVLGDFEALRELHDRRFEGRVFAVSKAGPKVQALALAWMEPRVLQADRDR